MQKITGYVSVKVLIKTKDILSPKRMRLDVMHALVEQNLSIMILSVSDVQCLFCVPSAQLQDVQHSFPHTLSSDVLMANCSWEFMVIWNRDPEVIYPLDQAMSYLKCIQNASLQHGENSR